VRNPQWGLFDWSVCTLFASTLFASALLGVRNVKKAMAYADAYLDINKEVPSGTNLTDLVQ
jgi:hypothetical protein